MRYVILGIVVSLCTGMALATIFGTVQGVVHDPQHRPIPGATVVLKSVNSAWARTTTTDVNGEFRIEAVPLGDYVITASQKGFDTLQQKITVLSGTAPVLHLPLQISALNQKVVVSSSVAPENTQTVTPTTLVSRSQIAQTPGANRTNSLQMITDYVPGAYVTHDMLHMRGGHQVDWLIDGVPIPNTNIAANLGPQIDPKDIDYLEVMRGSYDANYGDRTYGVFNIVPRTGFAFNNDCDLLMSFGSFYQANDQIGCGGHTDRFAYYASVSGNRSDYGLQTPIPQIFHDEEDGVGGFGSIIFNLNATNQFRFVGSLRQDEYQIPIDPNPNSSGNQILEAAGESPSYGLRDYEREPDGYVIFSWVHTFNAKMLLTVSPFYHYNEADYESSAGDFPVATTVDQTANYGGLQATLDTAFARNDLQAGIYGFAQHQRSLFDNVFTDGTQNFPASSQGVNGGLMAEFVDDKVKVNSWVTLIAGLRETQFHSDIAENATDPRFGATLRVPKLDWVFRGFYGYYYQAPPLVTATGALLGLAGSQSLAFAPLHGERDKEFQVGVTIPYRGWTLDADNFETRATNWLDHNNIGESNLFWPITWDAALIQGWELTLRSPNLWKRGQLHLAYSNQIAQATAPVTGGLICPSGDLTCFGTPGYSPVDHDQRNTLNVGFTATLPWQAYAATNVYYGSGFTNGLFGTPAAQYPGPYLPAHTTFDVSAGKTFLEKYSISVTALNAANRRVQLDNSLTFGGFHWNEPREIYAEFRYRFHF